MAYRKFIVGMFCVALAVKSISDFVILGTAVTPRSIGEVIGGAFALIIIPVIALFVVRLFRLPREVPTFTAGVLFALVAGYSIWGADFMAKNPEVRELIDAYDYAPAGCDFAVTFPSRPEIGETRSTPSRVVTRANLTQKRSSLVAMCVIYKESWETDEKVAMRHMEQAIQELGLGDTVTKTERRPKWIEATGKGTETVDGRRITHNFRLLNRKGTYFILIAESPTPDQFRPATLKFLNSARLKKGAAPGPAAPVPSAAKSGAHQAKPRSTGAFVFAPAGCDFAVTFPSRPKFEKTQHPKLGVARHAVLETKDTYLIAQCTAHKTIPEPTEVFATRVLKNQMQDLGLGDIVTKIERRSQWLQATGRGSKTVDGKRVTFEFRDFLRKGSMFSLIAGALSTEFPPAGAPEFFKSARLKKGAAPGPSAAKSGTSRAKPRPTGATVFSPSGCEYAVTFPGRPNKLGRLRRTWNSKLKTAEMTQNGSYLEATCEAVESGLEVTEKRVRRKLENFMVSRKIRDITISVQRRARWIEALGTGTQVIQGKQQRYRVRFLQRRKSWIALSVRGHPTGFPGPDMVEFLASAGLKR